MSGGGRRPGRGFLLRPTRPAVVTPQGGGVFISGTTSLPVKWSTTLTATVGVTSVTTDDEDAWTIPLEWSTVLDLDVPEPDESADPPPYIQRVSLTMPTPTLTSGAPAQPWTPTVNRSDWRRLHLTIGGTSVTRLRGIRFAPISDAHEEPFGDAEAAFALPGLTDFDDLADFGITPFAPVKLRGHDPGGGWHVMYEGEVASFEGDNGQGPIVHCVGALFRLDLLKQPPALVQDAEDYGRIIARAFNDKRRDFALRVGAMEHVDTDIQGVPTADFQPFLTGAIQDYLSQMTTDDGGQWTIHLQRPRTPRLVQKDLTTVNYTISHGAPGVDASGLSRDFTTATTAVYGSGTNGHCFPASTPVLPFGAVERGYRRWYAGPLVKVTTASGAELTATPNHPVMTGRGWVALGEVKEGDYLVTDPRIEGAVSDGPDVENMPAAISEVFEALAKTGLRERTPAIDMPFHGDVSDGEVEVVSAHGELSDGSQFESAEQRLQRLLVDVSDGEPFLADLRLKLEEIFAPGLSSERGVGGSSLGLSLLTGQRGDVQAGAFGDAASGDSEALEPVPDAEGGHAVGAGQRWDGLASEVAPNEVVVVDIDPDWTGHVYNLQTSSGVYSASGFLVANCTWMGARFPNLTEQDVPAFPLSVGAVFNAGDGQTGFAPFAAFLRRGQYGTITSDDTYDTDDVDNVEQFQDRAGITVDGVVGAQTWEAAFQPGANEGSIRGAYVDTIWERKATRRRLYNAQGADVGPNPDFDPTEPRIEEYVPFGDHVSKNLGRTSAKQIVTRAHPAGVAGTIVLTSDPTEGSRFAIQAGDNIQLDNYRGGSSLLHVTRRVRDWQAMSVTLTVDEKAHDQMTAAAIHQRRHDVSDLTHRQRFGRRKSKVFNDYGTWLCEDGAGQIPLMNQQGGFWNVQRIAAAPRGSIERISLAIGSGLTEHLLNVNLSDHPNATIPGASRGAVALFARPVTANGLANTLGNPVQYDSLNLNPWDREADELQRRGMIYAAGGPGAQIGFYPNDDPGDGSTTHLSGRFEDAGGITFGPTGYYWLWIAIFTTDSCLVGGRLFPGAP